MLNFHNVGNSDWEVVSTGAFGTPESEMESGVKCRLHLRRKPRHYVMNNALPAVPLGIFNLLVFVIPTDAREKNVSCDDRVSVSWCLFVELKYSTSH